MAAMRAQTDGSRRDDESEGRRVDDAGRASGGDQHGIGTGWRVGGVLAGTARERGGNHEKQESELGKLCRRSSLPDSGRQQKPR